MNISNFILFTFRGSKHKTDHARLHKLMIRQIRLIYPKTKIHVLSDRRGDEDVIYHVEVQFPDHMEKIRIFGLIDEPAMYLDDDLILTGPFESLPDVAPFNMYMHYTFPTYKMPYQNYNAGVIWIPRPSREITKEMEHIWKTHFDGWYGDEYPINRYVHDHSLVMQEDPRTNVFRHFIGRQCDIDKYQSVHYGTWKHMLEEELFARIKLQ